MRAALRAITHDVSSAMADAAASRHRLPAPDSHDILRRKLVAEVTRQACNLSSMMGVVLDKIHQHVHKPSRYAFHARLLCRHRRLEQLREVVGRTAQGALRLKRRRPIPIE
jgi:hypothetical protein